MLTLVLTVIGPRDAIAWGPEGHRVVGALAERLIAGTHAATQVHALLGGVTLAEAAVWADCAKGVSPNTFLYEGAGRHAECAVFEDAEGEAAMADFVRRNARNCLIGPGEEVCHKQYHYADVAIQRGRYEAGLAGTRDDDVVAAIGATLRVLKGDRAPAPFNLKDQREALLLIIHLVGDVHQPLHVGAVYLDEEGEAVDPDTGRHDPRTATRGGNRIMVAGTRKNLHALWDSLDRRSGAEPSSAWIAAARSVPPTSGADSSWPQQWASESVKEASLALSGLSFGPLQGGHWTVRLPTDYRREMRARKKEQLIRAGARLAQLLEDVWP